MDSISQTPTAAPAAPEPDEVLVDSPSYAPLREFLRQGHDEDIANWPPAEFTEYGQFAAAFLAQGAAAGIGGRR